jgi:aminoglycoside phosphotransferase family enzyme
MDHATIVEFMKKPGFYPHGVDRVDFLQTHISSIFLTGQLVYKLKKPMDFGFLDFSSVELRQENCEKELALNRRLAPEVYLRVEPITRGEAGPELGGGGPVVDWVVVMKQLDESLLGLNVLARGELTADKLESVVDILVPFYQAAKTGPGVDEFGTIATVKFNTDENFEQTADFVDLAIPRAHYEALRDFTHRFYVEREDLFERRISEGWIREIHGDLHLGNIFFEESPVIFDCIEFNDRLRCGDVAVDIGFLVMDLDFQGLPDLARTVVERYVQKSGDTEFLELVDFYACYRAYVRGKIACFTSRDPAVGEAVQSQQLELANRYFQLAHHYAVEGGHGSELK